jgi:Fic-DOC domain mobile mystery protein B
MVGGVEHTILQPLEIESSQAVRVVTSLDLREGPDGATPLDDEEVEGLVPSSVTTREQLNEWEATNIQVAMEWLFRVPRSVDDVLQVSFAEELHRRMFDQTWTWAGKYRSTEKNIGLSPSQVRVALRDRLADALVSHGYEHYPPKEFAARLHHQLVSIHPWPNGNGRWARLMADAYLHARAQPRLTWGGNLDADLVDAGAPRSEYLAAIRLADSGNFAPLIALVSR